MARVYRPYMRTPPPGGGETAWSDRSIVSPAFLELVRRDQQRAGAGMVGYVDGDPICACQDWGRFSYRILRIRPVAARRLVTVRLHNLGDMHRMTLVLMPNRRGGFVIDDLTDDFYRPSFKVWIARALSSGHAS